VSIEIRQTESLNDVEKQQLFGWGENIFSVAALNLRWRPKDLHFLLYVDSKVVSHVGVLKHILSIDGQPLTIGGVGGVVTVAEERKKGYARLLMQHAARFLKHLWEVEVGLLFCLPRMISYYEMLGWQLVEQRVLIDQPTGKIVSPLKVMVLPCAGYIWHDDEVKLRSQPW